MALEPTSWWNEIEGNMDPFDSTYTSRKGRVACGVAMGIMCIETYVPFIPGDVANGSTYDFPVRFEPIPGATPQRVVMEQDPALVGDVIAVAKDLQAQGVRAITSDCGYLVMHQESVAQELAIPVFLSSLLQAPVLNRMLGPEARLGIIVASDEHVGDELLDAAGVEDPSDVVVVGLQDCEHFRDVFLKEAKGLNPGTLAAEVERVCTRAQATHPDIGAWLFECSVLPPYGESVQRATRLPVFDWIGFVNYVHHAVVKTRYVGWY